MKVSTACNRAKKQLIAKAEKKGIYENFGQREVNQIMDAFDYFGLVYGTPEQRKDANLIDALRDWCENYTGGKY